MKVLILCTGNSCRSQMAQGYLQSLDGTAEICSAGTQPVAAVHPLAVRVMAEAGIDISGRLPRPVGQYLDRDWDYVITVCGGADESCPVFTGEVKHRLHIGFDDPAKARGTAGFVLEEFRRVRDEIKKAFAVFYITETGDKTKIV